ncbi:hypothetical protein GC175_01760 [bacterium]|nr:hypothetical protein [bacterium]
MPVRESGNGKAGSTGPYTNEQFCDLFPGRSQPAESPARPVPVFQFVEGLTDRQAADAVRGRIDWEYGLGLNLSDPGFDYSILSEFRARLIQAAPKLVYLTRC